MLQWVAPEHVVVVVVPQAFVLCLCADCKPGMGTTNSLLAPAGHNTGSSSDKSCSLCLSGFFGSMFRAAGDTNCHPCPRFGAGVFYYGGSINGYAPASVSYPGAQLPGFCLPEFFAQEQPNWWLPCNQRMLVRAGSSSKRVDSLKACVQACKTADCQFLNFDYSSKTCWMHVTAAAASGRYVQPSLVASLAPCSKVEQSLCWHH
jgi:hypothetical protein